MSHMQCRNCYWYTMPVPAQTDGQVRVPLEAMIYGDCRLNPRIERKVPNDWCSHFRPKISPPED